MTFALIGFWLGMLLLVIFTGIFLRTGFRNLQKLRALTSTPLSKIRSAAAGYVNLAGVIKPATQELTAPLSGKLCCWYYYCLEQKIISYDEQNNQQQKWVILEEKSSSDKFILLDDTGACLVHPQGADISSMTKEQWFRENDNLRCSEARLQTGEKLEILGMFQTVDQQHVVSNINLGDRPFVLSTLSLQRLIWRYRWLTLGHLLGFLVFGSIAAAGIVMHLSDNLSL